MHKGLHCCWRVVLLLAIFNFQFSTFNSVSAQDAFYVYRNDGDFQGFFFDQVRRMGVSKIDLDSVEHDVYVVQEIETTDSLYRIPLAAIDSIGFQQPEIRFNPRLRNLDELGLTSYVHNVNNQEVFGPMTIYFKDMPQSELPLVGDVVAGFNPDVYGDQGMVGKVREYENYEGGVVACVLDSISEWGDIFEQYITVEQIGVDEAGNVRRRVAGYDENGRLRSPCNDWSGNLSINILNWSGRLQYEYKPWLGSNQSATLGIDVGVQVKATASFAITGVFSQRFFVKLIFSEGLSAGASIHAQISGGAEEDITTPLNILGGFKFPAAFPLFEIDPVPKGFFRYGGSIDASLQLPTLSFGASQTAIIDTEMPGIMALKWGDRDGGASGYSLTERDFSWIDAGVVFSGFAQVGIKTTLGLQTNTWLAKLLHAGIGMDYYFGPKIEAELDLSASGALASGTYGAMKDSRVTLTPACFDREVKYKWRVGRQKDERTMWSDTKKWGEYSLYVLPEFLQTIAKYDEKKRVLSATAYPRRQVVLSSKVGIGLYPKGNFTNAVAELEAPEEYSYLNQFNEYVEEFHKPEAGTYNVAPFVRMFGVNMPVNDDKVYAEVTIPPYINIEQDSVVVTEKKQRLEIPFETNSNKVTVSAVNTVGGTSALNVTVSPHDSIAKQDTLIIEVDENSSMLGNSGDIVLTATHDSVTVSDTLRVIQEGAPVSSSKVYAKLGFDWKGTFYSHDSSGDDYTNPNAGKGGGLGFDADEDHKSYTAHCTRNGDQLSVEISVDMSRTPWSESTNNYPYQRTSYSGSQTETGHLSVVIDLKSDPMRVISGSFSRNRSFSETGSETHWQNDWGTVPYYVSLTENSTLTKSYAEEASFMCDLECMEGENWATNERYIRFEGINLTNWVSGSCTETERYTVSGTAKGSADGQPECYSRNYSTTFSGSPDPDATNGSFWLLIYY